MTVGLGSGKPRCIGACQNVLTRWAHEEATDLVRVLPRQRQMKAD
jgi:hypothetical protein